MIGTVMGEVAELKKQAITSKSANSNIMGAVDQLRRLQASMGDEGDLVSLMDGIEKRAKVSVCKPPRGCLAIDTD